MVQQQGAMAGSHADDNAASGSLNAVVGVIDGVHSTAVMMLSSIRLHGAKGHTNNGALACS
jgi:hypothetical protein